MVPAEQRRWLVGYLDRLQTDADLRGGVHILRNAMVREVARE